MNETTNNKSSRICRYLYLEILSRLLIPEHDMYRKLQDENISTIAKKDVATQDKDYLRNGDFRLSVRMIYVCIDYYRNESF